MPVLSCTNLVVNFGHKVILDGVSMSVEAGERIGVVGRNGTGKSTLLKALCGLVKADGGGVNLQRGSRAGYLHQDPVFDLEETVREAAEGAFAELHDLHKALHGVFDAMAGAEGEAIEKLLRKQEELEKKIDAAGGYEIDHKIEAVLHGVGISDAQMSQKVGSLSGGQKGRLALARLLLEEQDVLLLDEPTNHLDIDGRLWLEGFLKDEYRGAVVVISHDRYLLDHVVTKIVEVEQGRLIDYPGNYAAFREIRAQRRLTQQRAWENQQTKFRHEEEYIRRYKAGQRAKQARGRATKLEREKDGSTLERPVEMEAFQLDLGKAPRSGDVVVAARGVKKEFTSREGSVKRLFAALDVVIGRGERWGIVGPNGAGKTTLVRCLLGEISVDEGTVKPGSNLVIGYSKQTHEHLDPAMQAYEYLQLVIKKECPGKMLSEQAARDLAGAFLFSGEDQEKRLGVLSGGERARLVLAGLLASAKNLLVLDEPSNHLDIPSAERLEQALGARGQRDEGLSDGDEGKDKGGYDGTLILISHDRALIDATCDHLIVLDGEGGAEVFAGNYTQWHEKKVERARAAAQQQEAEKKRREESERARQAAAKSRESASSGGPGGAGANGSVGTGNGAGGRSGGKKRGPASGLARLSVEEIEARIEAAQRSMREADEAMGDPAVWKDREKSQKLAAVRFKAEQQVKELEEEWLSRGG